MDALMSCNHVQSAHAPVPQISRSDLIPDWCWRLLQLTSRDSTGRHRPNARAHACSEAVRVGCRSRCRGRIAVRTRALSACGAFHSGASRALRAGAPSGRCGLKLAATAQPVLQRRCRSGVARCSSMIASSAAGAGGWVAINGTGRGPHYRARAGNMRRCCWQACRHAFAHASRRRPTARHPFGLSRTPGRPCQLHAHASLVCKQRAQTAGGVSQPRPASATAGVCLPQVQPLFSAGPSRPTPLMQPRARPCTAACRTCSVIFLQPGACMAPVAPPRQTPAADSWERVRRRRARPPRRASCPILPGTTKERVTCGLSPMFTFKT